MSNRNEYFRVGNIRFHRRLSGVAYSEQYCIYLVQSNNFVVLVEIKCQQFRMHGG